MSEERHLADELLVRYFDAECIGSEQAAVEMHLRTCEACSNNLREIARISSDLEECVNPDALAFVDVGGRAALERLFVSDRADNGSRSPSRSRWRRFRLSAGLAAAIAVVVGSVAHQHRPASDPSASVNSSTFQVAGESFVALPYSNPDIPVESAHVVQMQMPVASLVDAGILLEPIGGDEDALDRSVLADVVIGSDGEPVGVHVVSE